MVKKSLRILLISFILLTGLFSGRNILDVDTVHARTDIWWDNRNLTCNARRNSNWNIVHREGAFVRWDPHENNAGWMFQSAQIRLSGGRAVQSRGWWWVRGRIGTGGWQHNGWGGRTMWVATTQLNRNRISSICRLPNW